LIKWTWGTTGEAGRTVIISRLRQVPHYGERKLLRVRETQKIGGEQKGITYWKKQGGEGMNSIMATTSGLKKRNGGNRVGRDQNAELSREKLKHTKKSNEIE